MIRVLAKVDQKTEEVCVLAVKEIGFDEDILGLYFVDVDDIEWHIKSIDKYTCNQICKEAMLKGYIDLSIYNEAEVEYE